jgi:hypothetical protein
MHVSLRSESAGDSGINRAGSVDPLRQLNSRAQGIRAELIRLKDGLLRGSGGQDFGNDDTDRSPIKTAKREGDIKARGRRGNSQGHSLFDQVVINEGFLIRD